MAQDLAQGLASLGRNNDSMLVHMTPREVQGLQSLAMSHGGSLTINPQTGLPEAGFLDSILPMVGGAALSPFMGPMAAGLLIGGVTALTSGDIGKGLMAGLGGYGGADLGKIFTKMGTSGGIPVGAGADVAKAGIAESLPAGGAGNLGMFTSPAATSTMGSVGATVPQALTPTTIGPGVNSAVNAMGAAPTSAQIAQSTLAAPSTYGPMGEGFGKLVSSPSEGFEAFKVAGGEAGKPLTTGEAAFKLGSPVASLALSGMEPEIPEPYVDPDTGKWRGPQGQLNLSDKWSTGLRLAEGGAITTGGIRDLYGSRDDQLDGNISKDGYGLGRLNNLANQQSLADAQITGYADGGGVVAGDRGMNLNELPSLNVNTGLQTQPGGLEGLNTGNPMLDKLFASRILNTNTGTMIDNPLYMMGKTLQEKGIKFAAKGGYLDGQGDGMSDSIPATIEGKQPARLADGEFVVPADVVSHLGNGSSKAGSKRLYAMLDKVRHARTGTKKQGKEINPAKYMPA